MLNASTLSAATTTLPPSLQAGLLFDQAADRLWTDLAINFADTIPGASAFVRDVRDLTEPFPGQLNGSGDTRFVEDVLDSMGEACEAGVSDVFVEIHYDPQESRRRHGVGVLSLWRQVGYNLEDRLQLTRADKHCSIVRLPAPSFMEGALQAVYGPDAVHWKYVSVDVTEDDILEGYGTNERYVRLSAEPLWLGDAKRIVDGLIFAAHDIYHGSYFAKYHGLRGSVLELARAMKTLPEGLGLPLKKVRGHLADMELNRPTLESLSAYSFGKLADNFKMERGKVPLERRYERLTVQRRWVAQLLEDFERSLSPTLFQGICDYFKSQDLVKVA